MPLHVSETIFKFCNQNSLVGFFAHLCKSLMTHDTRVATCCRTQLLHPRAAVKSCLLLKSQGHAATGPSFESLMVLAYSICLIFLFSSHFPFSFSSMGQNFGRSH